MVRRNAMARRLLVLTCVLLAVVRLPSVCGQETTVTDDGAQAEADVDQDAAGLGDSADSGVVEVRLRELIEPTRHAVVVLECARCCVSLFCSRKVCGLCRCRCGWWFIM